jgi:Flp pilus assembly protein TadG
MNGTVPQSLHARALRAGPWLRLWRARRGTVAVEFAFVLIVFLSVLFGIMAFGFQFAAHIALSYAAAEGGRSAVAGLSSTERQSRASAAITHVLTTLSPLIDPAKATITVTSGGVTTEGEAIDISISYSDSRFNVFPFLPALSTDQEVQTVFFVADPSG